MRIHVIMPTKNEAGRYLQSALAWIRPMCDTLFVYDDQSDDESVEVANQFADFVVVRGAKDNRAVSFLQHEGQFRQQMWDAFEALAKPDVNDWVLANDADEFLVDREGRHGEGPGGVLGTLRGACAMSTGHVAILLPVPEVFDVLATGLPLVRKDGYWGDIRGSRLFRYRTGGRYSDKAMGSGAEPTYVANGPFKHDSYGLNLIHYGYAVQEDRVAKYNRYTALMDHGHNNTHIQSILDAPTLDHWNGQVPGIWRGIR